MDIILVSKYYYRYNKNSNQHDYYDCYKPDNNICNFIFT
nr:MAG TPA: hypothetical protein [Caudoviricetes sp.]